MVALEIGLATNHATYDPLHLAFAIATGARGVVVSDAPFVRDIRRHPGPMVAGLLIPLSAWEEGQGASQEYERGFVLSHRRQCLGLRLHYTSPWWLPLAAFAGGPGVARVVVEKMEVVS
jgi:hypothetical protein